MHTLTIRLPLYIGTNRQTTHAPFICALDLANSVQNDAHLLVGSSSVRERELSPQIQMCQMFRRGIQEEPHEHHQRTSGHCARVRRAGVCMVSTNYHCFKPDRLHTTRAKEVKIGSSVL